ncbi:MAG: hypothetical protein M0R37_12790 [Bacteroidales bacterium]|nr:hypothetical protein [Bacteroidales bacterium]
MEDFDRCAGRAADRLSYRLWGNASELIALARERFQQGFDLYPDGPLFNMTAEQLDLEANEELADAIVYIARRLALADPR